MKRYYRLIVLSLLFVLVSATLVFADNGIKVMEVQDSGENPIVFVKGLGEIDSASALIGNTECPKVTYQKLDDGKTYIDTLILFDNSLSIPEESRQVAKEWVADFIADRKPYERFSIATYGEELESLIEFTDDYSDLKRAIDAVQYKDRDTYLTDVLYDLVNSDSFKENSEGAYRRILVISDGVDNKNVGYTTDELISLLNKSGMPVYTIGILNKKNSNGNELSNMFSISRATNALSATYGTDETYELKRSLKEDRNIIRFEVKTEDVVKDGSKKTVAIKAKTKDNEQTITVDNVRMAQVVVSDKAEETDEKETAVEEPVIEETIAEEEIDVPEQTFFEKNRTYIYGGVIAGILLIVIVVIAILVIKKKKKENQIIETDDPFADFETESGTEILLESSDDNDEEGSTVYIFGQGRSYNITLTDVDNPARMYQKPIQGKLVIGRSSTKADLTIDYDKSISSRHCMIELRDDRFYLVDLQSSNGTYLNDSRVLSEVEIYSGCVIKMGRVQMRIEMS